MNWNRRTFSSGMNMDKDERLLEPTEYSYALNIYNSDTSEGNLGVVTNAAGTELATLPDLPSGTNKTVGSYSDIQKERVFFFVWNNNADHTIYYFDIKTNTNIKIMETPELNFNATSYITGVNVVYDSDNGDLLFFTDDNSEPKKINVDAGQRRFDSSIYRGAAASPASYLEGQVVYADVTNFRYWYIATTATTTIPFTASNDPTPSADWDFAPIGYVYPNTIQEADITAMPEAPKEAPDVVYGDRWDLSYNRLEGKMWQFAYKWIYSDNTESAYSPFSKVPYPLVTVSPFSPSQDPRFAQENNEITIWCSRNDRSLVKKVRVVARYGGDDLSPTDFFLIDEFDVYDPPSVESSSSFRTGYARVSFRNDEVYSKIPIADANNLFSWIPRRAKAQELINGNRIAWANVLEGYPLEISKFNENRPTLSFDYLPIPSGVSLPNTYSSPTTSPIFIDAPLPSTVLAGETIEVVIPYELYDVGTSEVLRQETTRASYRVKENDTQDDIGEGVSSAISYSTKVFAGVQEVSPNYQQTSYAFEPITSLYDAGTNKIEVIPDPIFVNRLNPPALTQIGVRLINHTVAGVTTNFSAASTNTSQPKSSHKRGTTHKYGIVYSDNFGRLSTVYSTKTLSDYVNTLGESDTKSQGLGYVVASLSIFHAPPSWATKCHIVRTKSTPNHIYIPTSRGNTDQAPFDTDYFEIVTLGGEEFVDIATSALNGNGETSFNNAFDGSILSYSFTSGDRVRFIYSIDSGGRNYYEDDIEVISYDETVPSIRVKRSSMSSELQDLFSAGNEQGDKVGSVTPSYNNVKRLLMEIYTPEITNENDLYYEVGISLDIQTDVNGNKVHAGTDQNQIIGAGSQPAIIKVENGDVYVKPRAYTIYNNAASGSDRRELYYVEDLNFSDFYDSSFTDVGRPNLLIKEESTNERKSGTIGEIRRESLLRYSQPFIPETNINGLSTVYDLNFYEYDKKFNSIQLLHSEGDKLLIFQEDKIGFVYVGRQILQSLQGQSNVGKSDEILSDIEYYSGSYGISKNPESFTYNGFRKYFTDVNRGVVCRLSQDGITPISLNGMDSYFKPRFDSLFKSVEQELVRGVYRKSNDEYILKSVKYESFNFSEFDIINPSFPNFTLRFIGGNSYNTANTYVGEVIKCISAGVEIFVTVNSINGEFITFTCTTIDEYDRITGLGLDVFLPVSETVAFSERLNAWSTFYSYDEASWLSESALGVLLHKSGDAYVYYESPNQDRNNFVGQQYESEIEVVCNENPNLVKSFLNIKLEADNKDEDLQFYAAQDQVSTSNGQVSDILKTDLKKFEGHLYAPFHRDRLTGGNNTYTGDKLKGSWIKVKLTNDVVSENPFKLAAVSFKYFLSQFTR